MQTTQNAADLQAAIKKTLTSAAFGKFMEQAVHTAVAELQAQPDTITLKRAPMGRVEFSEMDDFRVYSARSADYTREINMQTERLATGVRQANIPGVWYGSERITSPDGSTWSRSLGDHVQDDFGMLVPLAALQGGAA